jgi:hypothetical protein
MVDLKLQGDVKTRVEKGCEYLLLRHVTLKIRTVGKRIYYYNHYYGTSLSAVDFEFNKGNLKSLRRAFFNTSPSSTAFNPQVLP